jgi:hypothetical protein
MRPRQRVSIDGFIRRPLPAPATRPVPRQQQSPPPRKHSYTSPHPPAPKKKRLPTWLETPLIIVLAMVTGVLAQSIVFGQLAIMAYGLVAVIWGIPSSITFTLALISMVATIVLLVGVDTALLAQNFATYTFLLLVAGVVSLGRELKKEGGRIYSIRERNINNW